MHILLQTGTRNRFFKHINELEDKLNRRLVCFEEELNLFKQQDLLNLLVRQNCQMLKDSHALIELNNLNQSLILNNQLDDYDEKSVSSNSSTKSILFSSSISTQSSNHSYKSSKSNRLTNKCSESTDDLSKSIESRSDDSNKSDYFELDNSTDSLFSSPKRFGPIIKSIRTIEKELKDANLKKDKKTI